MLPVIAKSHRLSDLLQGQLSELRQRTGQQANDERGWSADDVEHGGRQHRYVSVLPYKGVEQRDNSMAALGESTASGDTRRTGGEDRWGPERNRTQTFWNGEGNILKWMFNMM